MSGKRNIRLQILSDLHLEFGDYTPTPTSADVVILAGDIHVGCKGIKWVQKHFPDKPVIYVMGNHEFYGHSIPTVFKDFRARTETGNICLLENQSVQIGDWTFLGCSLWTDFALWPTPFAAMLAAGKSMTDYHLIKTKNGTFQPEDSLAMHKASLGWLESELAKCNPQKTVVVTHHAPSGKSNPPFHAGSILNGAFASPLDALVKQSSVPLWIHGHTHFCVDYKIGRTRVFSNQRGYPHNLDPGFMPDAVIEL